jgi:16S rRNA (uracil1498-N3)-methyltransferase
VLPWVRRIQLYFRIIARQNSKLSSLVPIPRFYCPFPLRDAVQVRLAQDAAHHAARVLRLRRGDDVVLFDGSGGEHAGSVHQVARDAMLIDVGKHYPDDRESSLRVCLAQALASGDKMDTILQKAVELSVAEFQPLATGKSVVKLGEERAVRRAQHWQQVVIAACEQCGRNRLPLVQPVQDFVTWVGLQGGMRLILLPSARESLGDLPRPTESFTVLVGPEGGFSDREIGLACEQGFKPIRLGPRVLRTETAGLAALAAVQALWGDF